MTERALEALNTLINPYVFLVAGQKRELADTIRHALQQNEKLEKENAALRERLEDYQKESSQFGVGA
jgi:regulator of replication initiation timing